MLIHVTDQPLDPWRLIQDYQRQHPDLAGHFGATSIFIGTMRDFNEGDTVQAMTLEHYPGMTERYLQKISDEALRRWSVLDTLIVHRYGDLLPTQPIVVIAVWSAHRAEAFDACRYLIEELKSRAPFWKKEQMENQQSRWVTHNTPS